MSNSRTTLSTRPAGSGRGVGLEEGLLGGVLDIGVALAVDHEVRAERVERLIAGVLELGRLSA
jgi:hypothetical protein